MTVITPNVAYRDLMFAIKTNRDAAVLPDTAYGALFTITGGRIIVMGMIGEVTTIMDGTATNLKVTATPTTGTAVDVATNVAVANKEVGCLIGFYTFGAALVASNAGAAPIGATPFVVPIGTLGITTSATQTGACKWSLFWAPLDDDASVAAAA